MVDFGEIVCHALRAKDVIAVLAVGEIIIGEICAGEDEFIVGAVELHVLQTPAFVDAPGDQFFPQPGQVRCVVHADFYPIWEFGGERGEKGCARGSGRFSSPTQGIRQDRD